MKIQSEISCCRFWWD